MHEELVQPLASVSGSQQRLMARGGSPFPEPTDSEFAHAQFALHVEFEAKASALLDSANYPTDVECSGVKHGA